VKIAGYEVHPAANHFPMHSEQELASLVESMRRHGFDPSKPVVLLKGKVLDGRNRLRASEVAGASPKFIDAPPDCDAPLEAWKHNGARRDLEPSQKAAIWLDILEESKTLQAEAERLKREADAARSQEGKRYGRGHKKGGASRDAPPLPKKKQKKTVHAVAAAAGVSPALVERAKANKKADPEAHEAVKAGTTTVGKETKKRKQAAARKKVAAQASVAPLRAELAHEDAFEFLRHFSDNSVNLLLTDPPYSTDVDDIESFTEWLPLALKKLKHTGRAYVCIGAYPVELLAYLSRLRDCGWIARAQVLVWTYRNTMGPKPTHGYKLNWQAILALRGEDAGELDCPLMIEQFSVQDINAPDGRQGDRYHAWQKPDELGDRFVRHSTKEGDLVVDPFAGTGSFLLSAARLGRRAIGCDTNSDNIGIAKSRGCRIVEVARAG